MYNKQGERSTAGKGQAKAGELITQKRRADCCGAAQKRAGVCWGVVSEDGSEGAFANVGVCGQVAVLSMRPARAGRACVALRACVRVCVSSTVGPGGRLAPNVAAQARPEMPFWYCLKRLGSRRSRTEAGTCWSSADCTVGGARWGKWGGR